MTILLFGATGKTGSCIQALLQEQNVSYASFVRSSSQARPGDKIGDVRKPGDVREAMRGASGIISALGTEGNGTLLAGTRHIIAAMVHYQLSRLVTIGTAGILQSVAEPALLRYQSSETRRTNHEAAKEHEQAYLALVHAPSVDWTIVCPTRLVQGQRTGAWREQADSLPEGGSQITFADTAAFAVAEYGARKYVRQRVGICE
jgi:putative NADH-flavin reductase